MKALLGLGIGLCLLAGAALGAGFDCEQAALSVERMICEDETLSLLDEKLALIYKSTCRALVVDRQKLRSEQRQWILARDECPDRGCVESAYQKRIQKLEEYMQAGLVGSAINFTGTYESQRRDNSFYILHFPDGAIRFHFSGIWIHPQTRMPAIGELTGLIYLKEDTAIFKGVQSDCRLTLEFFRDRLVVKQQGECGFGSNVNAADTYTRKSRQAPSFSDVIIGIY